MPMIMVVDDDEYMFEVLKSLLETEGYEVCGATSGPAALELVKNRPVDMIISKVRMTPMSGMEILRQVRRLRPNMRVVMLPVFGLDNTAAEAAALGAFGTLTRPFTSEEVLDLVKRAVGAAHA